MDPNEILKAAPEIAKGAAALGAAIPFTGIVKRRFGPIMFGFIVTGGN